MRKVLLLLVLFLACFVSYGQKMSNKFLEGIWETEFHIAEFKVVNKKELKIIITTKNTNELIDVLSYKIHNNNLYMETYYKPNDWSSIGKMVIMDDNTMVEDVVSQMPGLLIYKRKLIN
jgi:hypothetical protein